MSMKNIKEAISWTDFEKIDIRIGTIIDAKPFEKAKNQGFNECGQGKRAGEGKACKKKCNFISCIDGCTACSLQ